MDRRPPETACATSAVLTRSTPEEIELMDREVHVAVVFARWHETETATGLEE